MKSVGLTIRLPCIRDAVKKRPEAVPILPTAGELKEFY